MYLFIFAYLALTMWLRTHIIRGRAVVPHVPEPYATALFFLCCSIVAFALLCAALGAVGGFSSPADARFLIGSRLSQRLVSFWLQLRRYAAGIARMALFVLFSFALYGRSLRFSGIGLLILAGTVIWLAVAVPTLQLSLRLGRRPVSAWASTLAALGLLLGAAVAGSAFVAQLAPLAHLLEGTHGGEIFNSLLAGQPNAVLALWALAVALAVCAFFTRSDLYPELYAASVRIYTLRERHRRGARTEFRYSLGASSALREVSFASLRGAGALVWKDLVGFARSPSLQRSFALLLALCAVGGTIAGRYALSQRHPEGVGLALGFTAGNVALTFGAIFASVGLRDDIAKPLWWIGRDSVLMRLCAWLAGTAWRGAALASVAVIAFSLAMRLPALALTAVPLCIAAITCVYAVGLALYSIFPAQMDQRGPLAMLRVFACYLLAAPVIISMVLAGYFLHSAAAAVIPGVAVCVAETVALVAFAAWRIESRGLALAQAETL